MQQWKTQNRHSLVTKNLYWRNCKITDGSYCLERETGIWWMWWIAVKKMNLCRGNVEVSTSQSLVLVFGSWRVCYFFSQLPFWFWISYVTASTLFSVNHMNFGMWTENKIISICMEYSMLPFLWAIRWKL